MRQSNRKRREGVAPTVGLVVEGDTEYAALPLLHSKHLVWGCPPLRAINIGGIGSDRKPEGIAKLVAPKIIAHHSAGRARVVVCIDREGRPDCPGEFASKVHAAVTKELLDRGKEGTGFSVVIADRAFEAWILADAKGLHQKGKFRKKPTFHSFEGSIGSRQKKGVEELTVLLDREYSKTTDGPRLFAALDFAAARAYKGGGSGSKSLDKFLRELGV